jgi:lipid-A-disaccharide synthase
LPFEPDLYKKYDFPAVFVGHPLADNLPYHLNKDEIRRNFNINSGILIAILPGSRMSEVKRLGSYFVKAAKLLLKNYGNISFIAPMASKDIYKQFDIYLEQENIRKSFILVEGNSHECMIASDLVLAASGTAVLESSLLNRPTVAVYKVSLLSYIFLKTMIRIKHFTLPNILLKKEVVPELIQNDLSAESLSKVASNLLEDKNTREIMKSEFKTLRKKLSVNTDRLAAKEILKLYKEDK